MIAIMILEGPSLLQKNWLFMKLSKTNKENPHQLVANKVESLCKPVIIMSCYWALKQTSSELLFHEIKKEYQTNTGKIKYGLVEPSIWYWLGN